MRRITLVVGLAFLALGSVACGDDDDDDDVVGDGDADVDGDTDADGDGDGDSDGESVTFILLDRMTDTPLEGARLVGTLPTGVP